MTTRESLLKKKEENNYKKNNYTFITSVSKVLLYVCVLSINTERLLCTKAQCGQTYVRKNPRVYKVIYRVCSVTKLGKVYINVYVAGKVYIQTIKRGFSLLPLLQRFSFTPS